MKLVDENLLSNKSFISSKFPFIFQGLETLTLAQKDFVILKNVLVYALSQGFGGPYRLHVPDIQEQELICSGERPISNSREE